MKEGGMKEEGLKEGGMKEEGMKEGGMKEEGLKEGNELHSQCSVVASWVGVLRQVEKIHQCSSQQEGRTPQSSHPPLLLYRQVVGSQVVYSPWVTLP
jgi:hypothetical protein